MKIMLLSWLRSTYFLCGHNGVVVSVLSSLFRFRSKNGPRSPLFVNLIELVVDNSLVVGDDLVVNVECFPPSKQVLLSPRLSCQGNKLLISQRQRLVRKVLINQSHKIKLDALATRSCMNKRLANH